MLRSFPSGHRRTVALIASGLLVLSPAVAPWAFASDPDPDGLRDKQREVKKDINAAHDDLDESSAALRKATIRYRTARADLRDARVKLRDTRTDLAAAKVRDRRMQGKLERAETALEVARERLDEGRDDVRDQKDSVGDKTASIYTMGDPDLQAFANLLDAQSPDELIRMSSVQDAIADEDITELSDLQTAEVLLEVRETNVEKQKKKVNRQRKAAARNLKLRNRLERQATTDAREVRRSTRTMSTARTQAERVKKRDARHLAELKREQRQLEAKLRAIARANAAKHGGGAPAPSGGYLSNPVSGGYVTSPFGMRTHPIYGYRSLHDGVDFGGGCGEPLYAAADGTVISSYFQTAYGNRMVIDNGYARGVSVATIYNHATNYVVGVGDKVKRGQLIGYEGNTGWSTGCHLHFTVMVNGSAVDPMKWL